MNGFSDTRTQWTVLLYNVRVFIIATKWSANLIKTS